MLYVNIKPSDIIPRFLNTGIIPLILGQPNWRKINWRKGQGQKLRRRKVKALPHVTISSTISSTMLADARADAIFATLKSIVDDIVTCGRAFRLLSRRLDRSDRLSQNDIYIYVFVFSGDVYVTMQITFPARTSLKWNIMEFKM